MVPAGAVSAILTEVLPGVATRLVGAAGWARTFDPKNTKSNTRIYPSVLNCVCFFI
jgi:hypothetical protein